MPRLLISKSILLLFLIAPMLAKAELTDTATAPTLRAHLPADTLAYLRLPNPWRQLDTPKGTSLDEVRGAPGMQQWVGALRDTVIARLHDDNAGSVFPGSRLLLEHALSPLEVMVLPQQKWPLPLVLAQFTADFADHYAVNTWLAGLGQWLPVQVLQPLSADADGIASVLGQTVRYGFAADTRRVSLLIGGQTANGSVSEFITALPDPTDHPMWTSEVTIDSSGQGFFLWLNPQRALAFAELIGMVEEVAGLRGLGLGEARGLSIGMGTSGGKGRLAVKLDMPLVGVRTLLPTVSAAPMVKAAGEPRLVALLNLPSGDEFRRMENYLLGFLPDQVGEDYRIWVNEFAEQLGFAPIELLNAFGPECMVLVDEAGEFLVVGERDATLVQAILQELIDRQRWVQTMRQVDNQTIHHLQIPAPASTPESLVDSEIPPWALALMRSPSHTFWVNSTEHLYFAALPQVLMDRAASSSHVDVAKWLADTQGVTPDGNLVLFSGRIRDLPKRVYYTQIALLQMLADTLGAAVDVYDLPPAHALALPAVTGYSFRIASTEQTLAIELSFESNPLEPILAAGGIGTLAAIGIVSSIAMPGLQD